jgi:hypothetical protein
MVLGFINTYAIGACQLPAKMSFKGFSDCREDENVKD